MNTKLAKTKKQRTPKSNDAVASKKSILDSALIEFSTKGYAGARIDEISRRAGVSKPMIYEYFGNKDQIYAAALREAYVQIRAGESTLEFADFPPEEAIKKLVVFTLEHFRKNPWFISMLNTEKLRGGDTIRAIHDAREIQSDLIVELSRVIQRGTELGIFRPNIDPVELYIFIASLCYFPISNAHTLHAVFKCSIDDKWLNRRALESAEMIIKFMRKAS